MYREFKYFSNRRYTKFSVFYFDIFWDTPENKYETSMVFLSKYFKYNITIRDIFKYIYIMTFVRHTKLIKFYVFGLVM